jgi:uncharacterized repeat protein (TIGR03803 family)
MIRNHLSHFRMSVPGPSVLLTPSCTASRQDTFTSPGPLRCAGHVRSHLLRLRTNRCVLLRVVLTLLACLVGIGRATAQFDLATIYNFGSQPNDGQNPSGGLPLGTDGLFYGTALRGGTNGGGIIYTITPSGTLTTLYNFGSRPNDGIGPWAPLTHGTDGDVLADCGQIEEGDQMAVRAQLLRGAHHERRFSDLTRIEHIAELARFQPLQQGCIRLPNHIRGSVGGQCAPSNIKALGRRIHQDTLHINCCFELI